MSNDAGIRPFRIEVPQADLDDLNRRLRDTRWPNEVDADGWERGTELAFMRRLTGYWLEGYDWRAAEARLNRFSHHLARVRGLDVHFIRERAQGPDAVPILLLHGWADSFYRYVHLIDRLAGGGDGREAIFDVVVPSLPGFGFSSQPESEGLTAELAAEAVGELMAGLGYDRYIVHGGDWGSAVAQEIARNHPERVAGLHLTDVPYPNLFMVDPEEASAAEKETLEGFAAWGQEAGGYVAIQSTKPLTLSYGLSDSPVGLAAWLIEHFQRLSDAMPRDDDLLTNVMLYWISGSIRSSIRYYNEGMGGDWGDESGGDWGGDESGGDWDGGGDGGGWDPKVEVPTAFALFPRDIVRPPRELAERFFDVRRFIEMPRGGHFAALEEPDLLANDIRAFSRELG